MILDPECVTYNSLDVPLPSRLYCGQCGYVPRNVKQQEVDRAGDLESVPIATAIHGVRERCRLGPLQFE